MAKTSSETHKEEEQGCAKKGKWPPRGTGTTVLTFLLPNSQPCFGGSKVCARVAGKAFENGQNFGGGRQLTLDKTVGVGKGNLAPEALSTGPAAGRALLLLKRRDGSMYSQAYVSPRFMVKLSLDERSRL